MTQVNPNMIVLARETRGVTQKELAEQLKIEQYQISRIESGLLPLLAVEIIDDIAKALKYPRKFFFQTFQVYPPGMHLYRKHKTLPAKVLARIAAMMNIYREHIKVLLEAAEIDYKSVKECDVAEYGCPEAVAKAIRQYLMLPRGPVRSMTAVLEDLGVVVVPFDPATHMFSGASLLTEKPNYVTVINSSMPGDRCRYTLAHELAHIVMHSLPTPNMEEEADRFASEFLMPTDEIGPYLPDLTMDKLASLKKYWNVSMAAILKHAQVHGKITERQYRMLWEKMGKAGYRMREPAELDVPVEKPTILPQLLELHLKELVYTTDQLCDKLAVDPEEFARLYMLPERRLRLVSKFG